MAPHIFINNPRTRARGDSDPTADRTHRHTISRRRPSLISLLYDDDYKQYVKDCFQTGDTPKQPWLLTPPLEVDTIQSATDAYHWTHFRLKQRYCTPRSKAFLESYEKSLRAFLDTPEDIERKVEIRTMNQVLHSKPILYKEPDMRYQNALKAVTELAKLRYYSDYGDYVAFLCTSFRQKCVEAKVDNVDILIGKSWGQVQIELEREEEVREKWYDNHKQGERPPFCTMRKTLSNACAHLGLDYQNVRYCIEWYADRNKEAHSGVPFYIKNCDWKSLAHRLWQDWDGIPGVFGNEDKKMMEALTRVRDEFFIQLTAHKHIPSTQANILSQKKLDRQFARTKHAEDQKLAAAKKAETKQKREQDRSNQALERKEGRKRVERKSKPSGDSWQDQEESFGLEFY
ncbi:MAG: hypothetical protein LQ343_007402 [Gyalolechia ehrenbergii]|nr:MAG: hypothetical protein LQ343_007402 [Gyalolechia ehrenbergii]